MLTENIVVIIKLFIAYFLTFILFASWILKPLFKGKSIMYRLMAYEVVGNMYIIFCGYFLSFLKIFNTVTVYIAVFAIPTLIKIIKHKKYYGDKVKGFIEWYGNQIVFKPSLKSRIRQIKTGFRKKISFFCSNYLKNNIIDILAILAISVVSIALFTYFRFYLTAYSVADEEVHLYWISSIIENNAFPSGMYPHAMHFLVAFLSTIGFSQVTRSVMCFVILQDVLIFVHLYGMIRTLFRFKGAAIFGTLFFMISDIFCVYSFERYRSTLPMEFGYISICVIFIFLFYYIREKEKKSLILFMLSVAWSFQAHFYDTIWIVFICFGFAIVYLTVMIRQKQLFKILLAGVLGVVIALAPFGVGFACGYSFEQSIAWGMSVITATTATSDEDDSSAEEETNDEISEDQEEDLSSEQSAEMAETSSVEEDNVSVSYLDMAKEAIGDIGFCQFVAEKMDLGITASGCTEMISDCVVLNEAESFLADILDVNISEHGNFLFFVLVFGVDFVIVIITFVQTIFCKNKDFSQTRIFLFVIIGAIICLAMYLSYYLNLPSIMLPARTCILFGLNSAMLFAIPFEFLGNEISMIKPLKRFSGTLICIIAILLLGAVCVNGSVKDGQNGRYSFINEDDMRLCLDLVENEERDSWTVVSMTRDLSIVRFAGYHYEIVDLLEDFENKKEVYIPTSDFYVVVLKGFKDKSVLNESMQAIDNAFTKSRVYLYSDYEDVVYSKLYFWMEKMKTVYPTEIEVYSDTDVCTIYKVHQDPYFLLNLDVDYQNQE